MLIETWKKARKDLETATNKKTPCEKFSGIFNKSIGIADATKGLDEALAKGDAALMGRAATAFASLLDDYTNTLIKAAKEDKQADYKVEAKKLAKVLEDIREKLPRCLLWMETSFGRAV